MRTLCLIPARGGSQRIPRKNIRPFLGEPILTRVLHVAREAQCFDEIMVSTDDDAIAKIAQASGAAVPFRRSETTSGHHASTLSVILEVLNAYQERGQEFEACCCLYATAVLAEPAVLRQGLAKLQSQPELSCVFPVAPYSYPIHRSLVIAADRVQLAYPEHSQTRSQDLPIAYHDAGQWYWLRTHRLRPDFSILGPESAPLILPPWKVQDIDTEEDWRLAELKYQLLHSSTDSDR